MCTVGAHIPVASPWAEGYSPERKEARTRNPRRTLELRQRSGDQGWQISLHLTRTATGNVAPSNMTKCKEDRAQAELRPCRCLRPNGHAPNDRPGTRQTLCLRHIHILATERRSGSHMVAHGSVMADPHPLRHFIGQISVQTRVCNDRMLRT
eukprot:2119105-Alexandrium_andersonii.AAC.1